MVALLHAASSYLLLPPTHFLKTTCCFFIGILRIFIELWGWLHAVAGRTIRQTRHLPGAPGPIEGFWGPQNAPMHIFCPHIYYFYKNLFTIVASGCLITHILTIFPCAPPFSLHYMDYSMLRASRSSRVCRNDVKFKTVAVTVRPHQERP